MLLVAEEQRSLRSILRLEAKKPSAQGMVEFAMTISFLLLVILFLLEAARWFFALNAVQNAAQEAARYASTGQPSRQWCEDNNYPGSILNPNTYSTCRVDTIKQFAIDRARTGLSVDDLEDDITRPGYLGALVRGGADASSTPEYDNPGQPRAKVEVVVVYNHPIITPLVSGMLPTIRVVGEYQIVNEPWAGGEAIVPPTMESAPGLPPLDSDGDGWGDAHEINDTGTSPSTADTDGDKYCEGVQANWAEDVVDQCTLGADAYPLDPCRPDGGSPTCSG
jgi:hypothetical protein